jgi:hypothetical protein
MMMLWVIFFIGVVYILRWKLRLPSLWLVSAVIWSMLASHVHPWTTLRQDVGNVTCRNAGILSTDSYYISTLTGFAQYLDVVMLEAEATLSLPADLC